MIEVSYHVLESTLSKLVLHRFDITETAIAESSGSHHITRSSLGYFGKKLLGNVMKYVLIIVIMCCLGLGPAVGHAEVWSYACAEAMTLLREAQKNVALSHQRVYQSKLGLKLFSDGLETCRTSRRGFAGGMIHCVNHRSHGGVAIKEVMQAERGLADATRTFEERLKDLTQACTASSKFPS